MSRRRRINQVQPWMNGVTCLRLHHRFGWPEGCSSRLKVYSITACSGAADCWRSAALVEPIMIAKGMAHSVKTITIW
jgi:hypothetical protein